MKHKKAKKLGRKPFIWKKRDIKLVAKYVKNRAENNSIMAELIPIYKYGNIIKKAKEIEKDLNF